MNKKLGELRAASEKELNEKILVLRGDIAKEKAINASGTRPENPKKIKKLKKTIARALTILAQKQNKNKPLKKIEQKTTHTFENQAKSKDSAGTAKTKFLPQKTEQKASKPEIKKNKEGKK